MKEVTLKDLEKTLDYSYVNSDKEGFLVFGNEEDVNILMHDLQRRSVKREAEKYKKKVDKILNNRKQ